MKTEGDYYQERTQLIDNLLHTLQEIRYLASFNSEIYILANGAIIQATKQ